MLLLSSIHIVLELLVESMCACACKRGQPVLTCAKSMKMSMRAQITIVNWTPGFNVRSRTFSLDVYLWLSMTYVPRGTSSPMGVPLSPSAGTTSR